MPRCATSACAYQSLVLRNFSKAIVEYHAQDLAIAKEVGDRAGEGREYENLNNACRSRVCVVYWYSIQ
jgi:hypothetical protein